MLRCSGLCNHSVWLGYRLHGPQLCNHIVWLGYGLEGSWLGSWQCYENLLFTRNIHIASYGAHSASWSLGTGTLSPEVKCIGMKLTTHLNLVLKLNIHGAMPSWHGQGQLYICLEGRRWIQHIPPECWLYRYQFQCTGLHGSMSLKAVTLKRVEPSSFMGISLQLYWHSAVYWSYCTKWRVLYMFK